MSKTVELKVGMSCQGCAGAVRRVLGKMEGVESFDIDMETKKVTVKGNVEPEAVFEAVSKTGKPTSFWEAAPAPAVVSPAAAAPAVEAPIIAAPAVVSPTAAAPAAEAPIIAAPAAEPESKPTETVVVA